MAETWVLNATISLPSSSLRGTFTSNGKSFNGIQSRRVTSANLYLYYTSVAGSMTDSTRVYENGRWINDAYRTLVFDTAPTGNMLTWLQANGVKQSEPEPETPTNVCLIDGTIYGIKTGKTLIDGTAQTIYNGRTLVGGTGYDIVLSSSGFTVTIEGKGEEVVGPAKAEYAAVIINGTDYASAVTVEVEPGTLITLRTRAGNAIDQKNTQIIVDGVTVAKGTTAAAASYTYTPTGDITVTLSIKHSTKSKYGVITVVTT